MGRVPVHEDEVELTPFMRANDPDTKPGPALWTPLVLSRKSLIGFGCSFVLLGVALGLLYHFSLLNQGLVTTEEGLHYLWTYGPTALLTVVSSLWGLVDFRTRQLLPWKILRNGQAKAEHTLLLDYVTPWAGAVLWKSLKAGHLPVMCSTTGSLLLKLLIVFSTGLLTMETLQLSKTDVPLTVANRFSGHEWGNSSIDWRPLAALHSQQYPLGTSEKYAFEVFNATNSDQITANTTLSGLVAAFQTDMSCRVLADKLWIPLHSFVKHSDFHITPYNFTSPDNPEMKFKVTEDDVDIITPDCHLKFPFNAEEGTEAYIANCDGREALGYGGYSFSWDNVTSHNDHDLLLAVPLSNYTVGFGSDIVGQELTVVYCTMGYNIIQSILTIDSPLDPVTHLTPFPGDNKNKTLPGVTMLSILHGISSALDSFPGDDEPDTAYEKRSTLYNAFNLTSPRYTDEITEAWQNATVLKEAAEKTMPALVAQMAHYYLLQSANETDIIQGNMTVKEQRLVVRSLSFGLMEGTFALLLLISLAMFFIAPRAVCPRDPSSVGGLAMILAPSTALHRIYQDTSLWDFRTLKRAVGERQYHATTSHGVFRVEESIHTSASDNAPLQKGQPSDQGTKVRWWRPLSAAIPMQVLVFGLPVGLIIALEVLYQYSQKHDGIADINSEDSYTRYAYAYIPALAMFLVGVLYDSIDFTARLMQPYSLLRRDPQPASRGILNSQLGKWSPYSLFDSVRQGFPAVAATTVAVIVAKFLPIAVSGLYTAEASAWVSPISAIQTDHWDFTYQSPDDTNTEISGMLILNANLSYPQWTYDDLAFPSIQLLPLNSTAGNSSTVGSNGQTIQIDLPAARLQTNCTILNDTNSDIHFTTGPNPDKTVYLRVHVPGYCRNFNETWRFQNSGYFGSAPDAFPQIEEVSRGARPPIAVQNDCARWVTVTGYASNTNTTANIYNNNTVSALLCSPYFESVQTTVTLTLPGLEIDPSAPIIRHENTAKRLASFNNKTQIPEGEDLFSTPSKLTKLAIPDGLPYTLDVDNMFSAVVFGLGGTPIPDLVGVENIPNFQKAIQHTFGILEVQHLNYQFRRSNTARQQDMENPVTGTLRTPNRTRMVQSGVSTRILEAILAVMIVCAGVALWKVDTWHILPTEPGCIAVVLGLLVAGPGDILSNRIIPEGAQWWGDERVRKEGVFDGWLFRLGWWRRDYEDGDGEEEDEQREQDEGDSFGFWVGR